MSPRVHSVVALVLPFCLLLPAAAAAQEPVPVGGEFLVNTYTGGNQFDPAVSSDADGNFVVVWGSFASGGIHQGVRGQRFDASGNSLGDEFRVNTRQVLQAGAAEPDVASAAGGEFVAVWELCLGSSCNPQIVGQRFDASGARLGAEFEVSLRPPSYPCCSKRPAVAADDDGDFVVVWQGYDRSAPNLSRGIFGQQFDAMGAVLGGRFLVNTYITGTQNHAEVASDPQGNFVVVWDSTDATGKPGIFGQRYEASGNPLGGEFQINGHPGSGSHAQAYPAVASADDGSFVVVWEDVHGACCGDIRGRRFDAGGTPVGDDFQISVFTPTTTSFRGPAVSADADGGFVVAWASDHEDGSEAGLFGRRYDAAGVAMGGQFQINTYTTENQWQPAVSMAADGRFVVAWSEQPDPRFDVFAQRYAGPGLTLSVDGSCPGPVTVSVVNAPPNSEVALIAAANTNGFVKGGALCPGTQFEIGEPFQLPPRFVIVDGNGTGSALLDLGENRCHVQALAFATCETSNVVAVP